MNRRLKIAVADDEPDMREYLRRVFARMGHEVVATAANGRELVELCRGVEIDLLMTDINMPELNGIEAARQIYSMRPLPIILVSGFHDAELIERAKADHALTYLIKPIRQADLEPAIALAVRRFEEAAGAAPLNSEPQPNTQAAGAVHAVLHESPYPSLREVACTAEDGVVTLQGKVSSFYLKQLAQVVAGGVPGVGKIVNKLEVD